MPDDYVAMALRHLRRLGALWRLACLAVSSGPVRRSFVYRRTFVNSRGFLSPTPALVVALFRLDSAVVPGSALCGLQTLQFDTIFMELRYIEFYWTAADLIDPGALVPLSNVGGREIWCTGGSATGLAPQVIVCPDVYRCFPGRYRPLERGAFLACRSYLDQESLWRLYWGL